MGEKFFIFKIIPADVNRLEFTLKFLLEQFVLDLY